MSMQESLSMQEGQVTVNVRNLIDKILARYSGPNTVLRELLANADDAGATQVNVYWTKIDGAVTCLTVENDGQIFDDSDWKRLSSIADGQPQLDRIGAFGVGAYAVYSLTDVPRFSSGSQLVQFYWKDGSDALWIRREIQEFSKFTKVTMEYRDPGDVDVSNVVQFVVGSLAFLRKINKVAFFVNDEEVADVTRSWGDHVALDLPQGFVVKSGFWKQTIHPTKLVHFNQPLLQKALTISISIKTELVPKKKSKTQSTGFFGIFKKPEPLDIIPEDEWIKCEQIFSLCSAVLDVDAVHDPAFVKQMLRTMKKAPDHHSLVQCLLPWAHEPFAGLRDIDLLFATLSPDTSSSRQGHVFIGHTTSQTTGCAVNVAGRFIPTVEREALDLQDPYCAAWNMDLLFCAAVLCRAAYEHQATVNQTTSLDVFFPGLSTPAARVGQIITDAFLTCSDRALSVRCADNTMRPLNEVFLPSAVFQSFLTLPYAHPDIVKSLEKFSSLESVRQKGLGLREVQFTDVEQTLAQNPLNMLQMRTCLEWMVSIRESLSLDAAAKLKAVLIYAKDNGDVLPMHTVHTVLNPRAKHYIPNDFPLPSHLLPSELTVSMPLDHIKHLLGWTDLSPEQWTINLAQNGHLVSQDFQTIAFLQDLCRLWPNLSRLEKDKICKCLAEPIWVPTKLGRHIPAEAYGLEVNLFDDLPVIDMPKSAYTPTMQKMLLDLGLRAHADLNLVFTRLVGEGTWSNEQLVEYLVAIRSTLSSHEMQRLKSTSAFLGSDGQRHKASALLEPNELFLKMTLPVLAWSKPFRSQSKDGSLMTDLGLRSYPSLELLICICADTQNVARAEAAFGYLLLKLGSIYKDYKAENFSHVAFVPCSKGSQSFFAPPNQVYYNAEASCLGFLIYKPRNLTTATEESKILKIASDPPVSAVLAALTNNRSENDADMQSILEYLYTQISRFSPKDRNDVCQIAFLKAKGGQFYRIPQVFIESGAKKSGWSKLFPSVSYSEKANTFLMSLGVTTQPSIQDVARLVISEPNSVLDSIGGVDNYLDVLRSIAASVDSMETHMRKTLSASSCFIGYKQVNGIATNDHEQSAIRIHVLTDLKVLVVADDAALAQLFATDIKSCPSDEILEQFYLRLGCAKLSQKVKTTLVIKPASSIPDDRSKLIRLLGERLSLFLAEQGITYLKHLQVSSDWFAKDGNILVNSVSKIVTEYRMNQIHKEVGTSACAEWRTDKKKLIVSISQAEKLDYHDLAQSLVHLLFPESVRKATDTLLLASLFTTTLTTLQKRGFHVDKLLQRQQRMEADHREQQILAQREYEDQQRLARAKMDQEKQARDASDEQAAILAALKAKEMQHNAATTWATPAKSDISDISGRSNKLKMAGASLKKFSQRLAERFPDSQERLIDNGSETTLGGQKGATHNDDMRTIDRALQQSQGVRASNQPTLLPSHKPDPPSLPGISQSCDDGIAQQLVLSHLSQGLRVFRAGVEQVEAELEKSLVHIVTQLAHQVFRLPFDCLNIFHDSNGPTIAFNRGGHLFFNTAFHQRWLDQVKPSERTLVFRKWFLTFCHELAHNVVQVHDAMFNHFCLALVERYMNAYVMAEQQWQEQNLT